LAIVRAAENLTDNGRKKDLMPMTHALDAYALQMVEFVRVHERGQLLLPLRSRLVNPSLSFRCWYPPGRHSSALARSSGLAISTFGQSGLLPL
jgi:hypothetical protein